MTKLGPKQELGAFGGVALLALLGWYFMLYSPVAEKTGELKALVNSQGDSLKAVNNYNIKTAALNIQIAELEQQIATWDSRFPARTEIVSLAKQILNFGSLHNLHLVDMKPSLFELYALEKAGAHVSGRYMMQLPISCQFQGRYLDLGKALEDITNLPFNITVADVGLSPVPGEYPVLDIKLRLFLYVHL